MAQKALFMQQHGKAAPTFADFVSAPIDVQYERRKSKRRAVNKLLMPKGSTQMGYAAAVRVADMVRGFVSKRVAGS